MKKYILICGALLSFLLITPVMAASVPVIVTTPFGTGFTGLATSIVIAVTDATGTTHSVTLTAVELLDAPGNATGVYKCSFNADTSWPLPLYVVATITGQTGAISAGSIFTEREASVVDGYTSTLSETTIPGIPASTATSVWSSGTKNVTITGTAPTSFLSTDTTAQAILSSSGGGSFTIPGSHTSNGLPETLTSAQSVLLTDSEVIGDHVASPVSGQIQVIDYYLFGHQPISSNLVESVTINTHTGQVVGRLFANPFPSGSGT